MKSENPVVNILLKSILIGIPIWILLIIHFWIMHFGIVYAMEFSKLNFLFDLMVPLVYIWMPGYFFGILLGTNVHSPNMYLVYTLNFIFYYLIIASVLYIRLKLKNRKAIKTE